MTRRPSHPSDLDGELHDFGECHPTWVDTVDPEARWRAAVAVEVGRKALELPPVEVRWVMPRDWFAGEVRSSRWHRMPKSWGAWVHHDEPQRVYLRGDQPEHAIESSLHELRHLWQLRQPDAFPDYAGREADAIAWTEQAMHLPVR